LDKKSLSTWRERIRLELRTEPGGSMTFFLKRYVCPPRRVQWRRMAAGHRRRSTAGVEWYWVEQLRSAGIACPQPVALAERMCGLWEERSAILLAAVPGVSLERWAAEHPGRVPRDRLRPLAEFVRRFHSAGLVHRDLYLCHIFFDAESAEPFRLIDLQRVFRPSFWRRRWIVKDLAALNYSAPDGVVSRTDRLRWLRAYLGQPRLDRRAKRLARAVATKTRRFAAHDRLRPQSVTPSGGLAN
jgi:Ser/Thr protein kinase RdoA (MazF antagonist)